MLTTGEVVARRGQGRQEGPISIGAVRVGRGQRRRTPAKPARRHGAEAGNARRRDRRLRLRRQRRPRHPGQPRSVHEHDRLAVAAGEPDRDPAEGSRRSAHHADGDAAEQHHVAVAAHHSRLHLRRRASTPGGGGGRCMRDCDRRSRWSSCSAASAPTSISSPGRRRPRPASKQEKVFAGVDADKIEELKVDVRQGRRHARSRRTTAAGRSSRRSPPKADESEAIGHRQRARTARDRPRRRREPRRPEGLRPRRRRGSRSTSRRPATRTTAGC